MCRYPFSPDQPVQEADWEVYLRDTAQQIVEQQTPKRSGYNLHCNSILFDGYLPLNHAHKEKREIMKKKQTNKTRRKSWQVNIITAT